MKKIFFAITGAALCLVGCKEQPIPIDFKIRSTADTTYVVSPVPQADQRQVLVEMFTGQACPPCASAHDNLNVIIAQNPGRINTIGYYAKISPQCIPPGGSIHDFRDSTALGISSNIYTNASATPATGVDRAQGNALIFGPSDWELALTEELAQKDSVNISISSTYALGVASIIAKVTYTQAMSTPQNLSIVVVEDSMTDKQETDSGLDLDYQFNDVFRGMATSAPSGDVLQVSIGNNKKEAGRVFQKKYVYTLPVKSPAINPLNCRVIAFVNNADGADKHILQSSQCKLTN